MDVFKCSGCKSTLQSKKYINCHGCNQKYDLHCAYLSPERLRSMDDVGKRAWRCLECKSKQPKADNTNTPVRNMANTLSANDVPRTDSDHSNVTLRRKQDSNTKSISENTLRGLLKAERQRNNKYYFSIIQASVNGLSDQLSSITSQCSADFQESLTFVSEQNTELKREITELKKLLSVKSAEIKSIKDENKKLREDLSSYVTRRESQRRPNPGTSYSSGRELPTLFVFNPVRSLPAIVKCACCTVKDIKGSVEHLHLPDIILHNLCVFP
ncbi:unnamed protein product [Leptidea sinapis]|uniref:PHD-type domain-containing protein n=1 Tax=Leptidea sinapis TaxID=189913 RepID=A0A5E4PUJ1_9NEOP|nr:unnamed protein product [Leptidea sinapis]